MIKFICKNCKHWEKSTINNIIGYCNCDKFVDISEYYSWHSGELENAKLIENGVHYFDLDGYGAGSNILVGENFGCIHFECDGIVLSDGEIAVNHSDLVVKAPLTGEK